LGVTEHMEFWNMTNGVRHVNDEVHSGSSGF
ncbi:hypothetical protein A2U01_0088752, partial [Trifolium medium]|nr:hypothetical protein [Trifolium medium]